MTSTIGIPIKLLNEAQARLDSPRPGSDLSCSRNGSPLTSLLLFQGHIITLEITSGQTYRGKLLEGNLSFYLEYGLFPCIGPTLTCFSCAHQTAEDNMNVQLKDITVTARDGRVSHLDQVYIRGSHVRFFIVPDMLRNAPMFRSRHLRGRGVGLARGRATVSRARASGRGGR